VKVTSRLQGLARDEQTLPDHADQAKILSQRTMAEAFNRCR
jgi:hypothetical protein